MYNNKYFKPSPIFKEFKILDLIEKKTNLTQRVIGEELGVAVSMVNLYLTQYEDKGFVRRKYITSKCVFYSLTSKGIERKKILNIGFLNASQKIYQFAKENIQIFLNEIIEKGYHSILLYGAGEVAEILMQVIIGDFNSPLEIVGVIDDNPDKQGKYLLNTKISSYDEIEKISHDGILISSYTKNEIIYDKLKRKDYNCSKILQFFNI